MSDAVEVKAESTTEQVNDFQYNANVVVRRTNGNLNITGTLNQSAADAGCAAYAHLRRSAANRCGGITSSMEDVQLCLRRNQGKACADAFPDDAVRRNECYGCISQASVDPRLNQNLSPSGAHCGCGCARRSTRGHQWFFLIMILIVLAFLTVRLCQSCQADAPPAAAAPVSP